MTQTSFPKTSRSRRTKLKSMLALLICMILMVPTQFAYASKYSEYETVELKDNTTGYFKDYEPVNLMIRGIDVFSDAPGIIVNSRTIVPVSAILIELGVKYQWNGATREISFTYDSKTVIMQVGNQYAKINGVKTLLPDGVAPRIMTYKSITGENIDRTYVPLKFVSDVLGLSASWIPETRTVAINKKAQTLTGVKLLTESTYPEIRLKVSGEVDATSFLISGTDVGAKDKIVVDLQNTILKTPSGASVANNIWTQMIYDQIFGLEKIEITQTGTNPYNTRVTVYQSQKRGHDIFYDSKTGEIVIQLINTVNDIGVHEIYSTDTVVIGTSETPFYNVDINGKQIVVDVLNSYLKINQGVYQVLPVEKGKIEAIAFQQLNTDKSDMYAPDMDVTRITIELKEAVTYDDFYVEDRGSELLVYVTKNPIYNFDYIKLNDEQSTMKINLFAKTELKSTYDAATRKVTFEIPKDKTDLGSFDQPINDNVIDNFVVTETDLVYKVVVTLAENTTYTKSSLATSIVFNFTNAVIQNSENKQKLIVIDAGHGGKDPGAVGTKTQEKILTLKAAKMLESELQKQGFKVYLTRSTDEYVGLYDRAVMANDLDATVFVSIHINAFTSSTVSGIETFYGNDSMSSDKGLAQNIQTQLIAALNAVDRGIDSRPRLVVLKETFMTSVLCELGFITNPSEQDKLISDAYLQKAAAAMARGIVNFLK